MVFIIKINILRTLNTEEKGRSEQIITKNIAGFMNSEGGTLLIGIADDKRVVATFSPPKVFTENSKQAFMTLSITIPRRAKKQLALFANIPSNLQSSVRCTVEISGVYTEEKRVNDAYRYIIQVKSGNASLKQSFSNGLGRFQDKATGEITHPTIVLVIESPHKDEYKNRNPVAPAQGTTGRKIEKYLTGLLNTSINHHLADGDYDFIVSNPVQFQASLFDLHGANLTESPAKAVRDSVWKEIFPKEESNFHQRLTTYEPKLVINACTSMLLPIVEDSILCWKGTQSVDVYKATSHPCFWHSKTTLQQVP
jgi:hypothetical protein